MTASEIVVVVMLLVALWLLPKGATDAERERIAAQCKTVGGFEADGVVFKCKEKASKP